MIASSPLDELAGKTIRRAQLGVGTMFTLELGPDATPGADGLSDWSIWFQHCSWRIASESDWIGSDDDLAELPSWMHRLDGRTIGRIECHAYADLSIELDGGFTITTFTSYKSDVGDPWVLFTPSQTVSATSSREPSWDIEKR
jgi:hypothetical protein